MKGLADRRRISRIRRKPAPAHADRGGAALFASLGGVTLPGGDGFAQIGTAAAARAVRTHIISRRGHSAGWINASGYRGAPTKIGGA